MKKALRKARKFREMPTRETLDKTACWHCGVPADTICEGCRASVCYGCCANGEDVSLCVECVALLKEGK